MEKSVIWIFTVVFLSENHNLAIDSDFSKLSDTETKCSATNPIPSGIVNFPSEPPPSARLSEVVDFPMFISFIFRFRFKSSLPSKDIAYSILLRLSICLETHHT